MTKPLSTPMIRLMWLLRAANNCVAGWPPPSLHAGKITERTYQALQARNLIDSVGIHLTEQGEAWIAAQLDKVHAEALTLNEATEPVVGYQGDAEAARSAEIMARVTGSVGATHIVERVEPDGSITELARGTWTRPVPSGPSVGYRDDGSRVEGAPPASLRGPVPTVAQVHRVTRYILSTVGDPRGAAQRNDWMGWAHIHFGVSGAKRPYTLAELIELCHVEALHDNAKLAPSGAICGYCDRDFATVAEHAVHLVSAHSHYDVRS
jgi:hypothetical protein